MLSTWDTTEAPSSGWSGSSGSAALRGRGCFHWASKQGLGPVGVYLNKLVMPYGLWKGPLKVGGGVLLKVKSKLTVSNSYLVLAGTIRLIEGDSRKEGLQTELPADWIAQIFRTQSPGRLCPLSGWLCLFNRVIVSDSHSAKMGDNILFMSKIGHHRPNLLWYRPNLTYGRLCW